MIFRALYQFAQAEHLVDDPDYELKSVKWLVIVEPGGTVARIVSTGADPEKAAGEPKLLRIPRQSPSRSGTKPAPEFLVDNAKFTFGMGTIDKPIEDSVQQTKARNRAASFLREVELCAGRTNDEGVMAVAAFLRLVQAGMPIVLDPGTRPNDLFGFVYSPDGGQLVTDRPKVEAYWRALRSRHCGPQRRCLILGTQGPTAHKHKLLKNLPGAISSGAALISFGSNAFESYGWRAHENATISVTAAESCGAALNRLLGSSAPDPFQPGRMRARHNIRLASNMSICFWGAKASDEFCSDVYSLLEANYRDAASPHEYVRRFQEAADSAAPFYVLMLSGAQGRASVRLWVESSTSVVAANIAAHLADIQILLNPSFSRHCPLSSMPVSELVSALVPDGGVAPGPLVRDFVEAVFTGSAYPAALLHQAILRERAEIGLRDWQYLARRDARIALIKGVLNRKRRSQPEATTYREVMATLDPANECNGYILGRMLAASERLSQISLGTRQSHFTQRYFNAIFGDPIGALTSLLQGARRNATAAQRDSANRRLSSWLLLIINGLTASLSTNGKTIPDYLDVEQQAFLILGYYHMRYWLWMTPEERDSWRQDCPVISETIRDTGNNNLRPEGGLSLE